MAMYFSVVAWSSTWFRALISVCEGPSGGITWAAAGGRAGAGRAAGGRGRRRGPGPGPRPGPGRGRGRGGSRGRVVVAVVARWDDGAIAGEKGMKWHGRKPRRRGVRAIAPATSALAADERDWPRPSYGGSSRPP